MIHIFHITTDVAANLPTQHVVSSACPKICQSSLLSEGDLPRNGRKAWPPSIFGCHLYTSCHEMPKKSYQSNYP